MNVVILGHSFIRRLRELTEQESAFHNLRLSKEQFKITFRAKGGLTLEKLKSKNELLAFHSPDIVFLQIGGNDLGNISPFVLVQRILELVNALLLVNKAKSVIIGQLFWRDPRVSGKTYNDKVIGANQLLAQGTKTSRRITFWQHRGGFWKRDLSFLKKDGVHLNPTAQRKYLQSVKAAILTASKQFN
ncbi:uncharacterized protein LOC117320478 [Pecten maximus]|uniref:uncharacterized protein LOC117319699 n=1 Tax=Pecten maximus TaxID=6579 RepID=UPI001458C9C1|nr:uncharacterized protein LOC117319699 [Pecten maximus]XP_033730960.1 uncharacterized protein LOC117320478 [Pecten maximus]